MLFSYHVSGQSKVIIQALGAMKTIVIWLTSFTWLIHTIYSFQQTRFCNPASDHFQGEDIFFEILDVVGDHKVN